VHQITELKECDSIVEATSEEVFGLWCRHAPESDYVSRISKKRREWREQSAGFWREIGRVLDRPICVSVQFATVDGRRIAFVEGCSELVDHKMIRGWIDAEKRDAAVPVVNAANFHNAFP
jgi:hypothetical protein